MFIRRLKFFPVFLLLALPGFEAHASDLAIYCGSGRDLKSAAKAELALVDSPNFVMQFYLGGKLIGSDQAAIKPVENWTWIVTLEQGGSQPARKFVVNQKAGTVQEYRLGAKGAEKIVGGPKPCVVHAQNTN